MNITLQPRVLRWVRERAGLSKADLAAGLGLGLDKIDDWEHRGALTFGQAERLAKKTHAPLGYLFLQEPLRESLPIPDLRTVAGQRASVASLELLGLVACALAHRYTVVSHEVHVPGQRSKVRIPAVCQALNVSRY
jgi:transcriptional regulator with XRE-family HTH domain